MGSFLKLVPSHFGARCPAERLKTIAILYFRQMTEWPLLQNICN
jgi:hypothetical protein